MRTTSFWDALQPSTRPTFLYVWMYLFISSFLESILMFQWHTFFSEPVTPVSAASTAAQLLTPAESRISTEGPDSGWECPRGIEREVVEDQQKDPRQLITRRTALLLPAQESRHHRAKRRPLSSIIYCIYPGAGKRGGKAYSLWQEDLGDF